MQKLIFYTDGACSGNPGAGGFGVVCLTSKLKYKYSEKYTYTTNNRMELMAILHVLKLAKEHQDYDFTIYSDSSYAVQSINTWIYSWSRNGWQNSKKQQVENIDLMKEIYTYIQFPMPNFHLQKVKGHNNIIGNELADRLAVGDEKGFNNLIQKHNITIEKGGIF